MGSQTLRKLHLVFRESPDQDSLVFTSPDRAMEIDRLRRAIETSETWGEFRRRIGPEAHADLYGKDFYDPEDDSEDSGENALESSGDARCGRWCLGARREQDQAAAYCNDAR